MKSHDQILKEAYVSEYPGKDLTGIKTIPATAVNKVAKRAMKEASRQDSIEFLRWYWNNIPFSMRGMTEIRLYKRFLKWKQKQEKK